MDFKRITLFAGHYGSGKTNLAVNCALHQRMAGHAVTVLDLDIVNPYFRTKDSSAVLEKAGIRLIASQFANTNVDVPALPPDMYAMFGDPDMRIVVDVGGDDAGAAALGRFAAQLAKEDFEMLLVVNKYRPLTATSDGAYAIMRDIEKTAHIPFTAIADNPNLGSETDAQTVLDAGAYARDISAQTGLNVKFTAVRRDLAPLLDGIIPDLFPIDLYGKEDWAL